MMQTNGQSDDVPTDQLYSRVKVEPVDSSLHSVPALFTAGIKEEQDALLWNPRETVVDNLRLLGVKPEQTGEQGTCSPETTFVSVDMDLDYKTEESALSAVDPLLLPCLKMEDAAEVSTNLVRETDNIRKEVIECDPLRSVIFGCDMCEKTYVCQDELNLHILMNDCVPSYTCDDCGQHFSRKDVCFKHMSRRTCRE